MRALLDVNVLLALFDPDHAFHQLVTRWWEAHERDGWASTPTTQNGVLRISSRPIYTNPIRLADGIALLRQWAVPPLHDFWPDDMSLLDSKGINHHRLIGHGQITDAYLLAIAVRRGGRLVTMNRRITIDAVKGATPEHLVIIV